MPPTSTKPPTRKQLSYLRSLAERNGQTFTYPRSSREASDEIRLLPAAAPSTRVERIIERHDWAGEAAARETHGDVPLTAEDAQRFWSSEYTPLLVPAAAVTPNDGSR